MSTVSENIVLFLEQATQELLYNIVFVNNELSIEFNDEIDELHYRELSERFEEKTGHRPMDFFGLGNHTGMGWFDFLRCTPGLDMERGRISLDVLLHIVYDEYNTTTATLNISVAEYREMLLIAACKQMPQIAEYGWNSDTDSGNSPLHLVAAMPGSGSDEPTLLRYLLEAGLDPLQENNEGLNILHIIAGRIKAEEGENGELLFESESIDEMNWPISHRKKLLDLLSQKLSPPQLSSLMSKLGRNGNTVMHEWVSSTSSIQLLKTTTGLSQASLLGLVTKEIELASILLSFGGNLRIPNRSGLVPLHYACNSTVFQFLLQNGAVCRSRSDQDETPFLFILKLLAREFSTAPPVKVPLSLILFRVKNAVEEILVKKAVLIIEHLIKLFDESEEVRKTVWIPDIEETSPLEIVLVCVRILSHRIYMFQKNSSRTKPRSNLIRLLKRILSTGNPGHLRHQNKKGQGPLHILLNKGNPDQMDVTSDSEMLDSLQLLLQYGADVNEIDAKGNTALDVAEKHFGKMSLLYKACEEALLRNVSEKATEGHASVNNQSQTSSTLGNATRKLRSDCPKCHVNTAEQLTKARRDVTVVQKYRYFSQTPIGSGAFSSIYVAIKDEHVDPRSGRIDCRAIALKRLEKAKINPQEVKREVQALLSFSTSCENILNCYESIEDDFFHYLCLELMDGDLQQFVEDGTMKSLMQKNSPTSIQATCDIINGLSYLHEKNFLHRDLKPGNVLYTIHLSLYFKIADFGLAKNISSSSTMTSTKGGGVAMAPGTRCWMAPELVSLQSREHTKESDVFALGLVLHYLLSMGKHPFVGAMEEPTHVIEKSIVDMKITMDRSLSNEAEHFIRVILVKNPSHRPPTKHLKYHPFLWSEKKKIEFLKAIGDQPEAIKPADHPNSVLEQSLQKTSVGRQLVFQHWDQRLPELFSEMTRAWKQKKYRTGYVIDLIRFLRNAYTHKEERSPSLKVQLDNNIFLKKFPSLVLDVFKVVQAEKYNENRSNIQQTLLS